MIIKQSNMEKVIEGYKNKYTITKEGDVFSYVYGKPRKLKAQKASQSSSGYFQVRLFNHEYPKGRLQYVHRIAYETFKGEIPSGVEIDHIDGDTSNNKLDNLQLMKPRDNKLKYLKGKDILWRDRRDDFIKDYEKLGTYKKVAEKYGTSIQVVFRVIKDVIHKIDWEKDGKTYHTVRFNPSLNDEYTDTDRRKIFKRKKDAKGRFKK